MENTNVVIRPFDAVTDLKKLSNIWFEASMKAHPFIGEARLTEQRRLIEAEYLPKAETSVACLDGEAVGFISLLGRPSLALLENPPLDRPLCRLSAPPSSYSYLC